jgi:hypothetical protein
MKQRKGSQRNAGRTFSLLKLTRIGRRMFWWTKASISCSKLSEVATCEHTESTSSPTHFQLIGRSEKPGEHSKHSPNIPGPLKNPGARDASHEVALLETPVLVLHATKSYSELSMSSLSRGPAPTPSWPVVPCKALPALGTSNTDATIGRIEDVARQATDRWMTRTNETRLLLPQNYFLESA